MEANLAKETQIMKTFLPESTKILIKQFTSAMHKRGKQVTTEALVNFLYGQGELWSVPQLQAALDNELGKEV